MHPLIKHSLLAILLAVGLAGCEDARVGSAARPFTVYFVPSVEAQTLIQSAETITEYLEEGLTERMNAGKETFHVESTIPNSYIAVVEAFDTKKADFAALNTFSYILGKDIKGYDMDVLLTVVRGEGETSYKGQIIARADSGIENVEDLQGKKFAFTNATSTAGYVMPMKLFKDKGIEVGDSVMGQAHDVVVTMVYQGQVDAGACYYSPPMPDPETGEMKIRDARAKVKTQYPDVEEKIKIVGFTDEIPNDPWVVRGDIFEDPAENAKLRQALQETLLEFAATPEGEQALQELYSITGLAPVEDSRYDSLREALKDAGMDIEAQVAK